MAEPTKRRGTWKLVLLAVVVIGAGLFIDWQQLAPLAGRLEAYLSPPKPDQTASHAAPAVPVSAAKAVRGDFPVVLSSLGTVQAYNTVLVRTRVDGQIMSLHFEEGQIVHAGDLLAEIDPRPFRAALDQANAKAEQDQASLDNAKRDLTRYQSLAKSDYATRQQLDTQTAMVAQLTAQIASDAAAAENAKTQLDYCTITAPITGRTGFRLVDQGNIVNSSSQTGIVSIAQIEPIAVIFTETEDALGQIAEGLKEGTLSVTALSSDGSQTLADGRLETFNNQIDTSSGTVRLKAAFDNKDHKLWPGLSVSTKLTVAVKRDVVLIPFEAVQRNDKGLYTFVIGADNTIEQRPIKVRYSNDHVAVVDEGIRADEQVATGGQYRLQQGTLVKILPNAAQQTSQRDS